eukprot:SAG31_NODE_2640_length_5324_cov_5.437835_3_plen_76_part_00
MQWNKIILYTATNGWDEKQCQELPTVCATLKGKLRSEQGWEHVKYKTGLFVDGDEAVILFRLAVRNLCMNHLATS